MNPKTISVSPGFKAQARKAILSIVFFILSYLFMLAFALVLTGLCLYGAINIVMIRPSFVTIALAVGLASLGVLVLIFLVKFMFKSHQIDRSHLLEITQNDEPELFSIIHDIVAQVGTSFPKKVYLSTDVNAAVFYDSNFWSMFFPVKKNLQIGMGLVNSITKAELTAILGHEFGHFSQESMKVGSYVYNVNQVIYNLLYDNQSYDELANKWASMSGYFSIFVIIAVKINQGFQWVLRKIYDIVNISYMGLSREMEFHADEIAASVTGMEPLKSSLLRMNLADFSFNNLLAFYDGQVEWNRRSENIFVEHAYVMNFLAEDNELKIKHGFPQISLEELNKFNKSKLVVKDQWASHPSTEDRIAMLDKTGLSSNKEDYTPANLVFKDIEKTQKEVTNVLFKNVEYKGDVSAFSYAEFQQAFMKDYDSNTFSKLYNGYYDNKNPLEFDWSVAKIGQFDGGIDELFSTENVDLVYTAVSLQNDLEAINQIKDQATHIKTFDYDGKKYSRKDCAPLIVELSHDLTKLNEQIKEIDIKIYQFFSQLESLIEETPTLDKLYQDFFHYSSIYEIKQEIYTKLSSALEFLSQNTPFDQIERNFIRVRTLEDDLKEGIKTLLSDELYKEEIRQDVKDSFALYLSKDWQYFSNEQYFEQNLEILFSAMNAYAFLLSRGYFLLKKRLLDYQVELYNKTLKT